MINIFNRQELINTFSLEIITDAKAILSSHSIEYLITTKSHDALFVRGTTGTQPPNNLSSLNYKLFVNRKNYQQSKTLLGL